jgi:XTP/dITP diphosphohydrolase
LKVLVAATRNRGKLAEIRGILGGGVDLRSVADIPGAPDVVEDGLTFEANAVKKATEIALCSGLPALADDSGLEVDALAGAPGVYSARFAGPGASDAANNAKLLSLLGDLPDERRTARFRCTIAVALPGRLVGTATAAWEGRILFAPRGSNGFGYDPLFLVPGRGLSCAELPADLKNALSHRGQALRKALPLIEEALGR